MSSAAENGLSFIETSALDASNVESAFQTILTGAPLSLDPAPPFFLIPFPYQTSTRSCPTRLLSRRRTPLRLQEALPSAWDPLHHLLAPSRASVAKPREDLVLCVIISPGLVYLSVYVPSPVLLSSFPLFATPFR